jgi:hypothetical protein
MSGILNALVGTAAAAAGGTFELSPLTIASNRTNSGAGYLVNDSTPNGAPSSASISGYLTATSQTAAKAQFGTSTFNMPIADGYIYLVIPATGTYRIQARGGPGGPTGTTTYPGSGGATVQADFVLQSGDYLWMTTGMAGSAGNPNSGTDQASAGGGGFTGVALKTAASGATTTFPGATSTILLFAGGGIGSAEPLRGGGTTNSSANDGGPVTGANDWQAKSVGSSGAGFGGQTAYGGWGGASGSDDGQGTGGGYSGRFSGFPNSFINASLGTNLVRTDGTRANTNWPNNGFITITKI